MAGSLHPALQTMGSVWAIAGAAQPVCTYVVLVAMDEFLPPLRGGVCSPYVSND